MCATGIRRGWLLLAVVGAVLLMSSGDAAPQQKPPPRPEAVAETRLLMEALAHSNFRGLERMLREKPAEADAWVFIRGQALLIAETSNLLLFRPPRSRGQEAWMDGALEQRERATALARAAADKDFERSRAGLVGLSNTCNRCHQTFRVPVRLTPFAGPADRTDGKTVP